jgi:hypothetical protein
MVHHPYTGQNLLMVGTDLLDEPTGTVIVQRSETGQGILGVKDGKGMWVWSVMVLVVLSSRMSTTDCSLAGHRDNVPCLVITTISNPEYRCDERLKTKTEESTRLDMVVYY